NMRRKRRVVLSISVLTILSILVGCSRDIVLPIEDVVPLEQENHFSSIYDGLKHDFIVYLPDERTDETPLILMLPGYGSSAENFRSMTLMDEDANEEGYAVVYVTGASDPEDKTSSL